jgi:hypothetical protein
MEQEIRPGEDYCMRGKISDQRYAAMVINVLSERSGAAKQTDLVVQNLLL